ncbi:MAG TPA: zinc ribbon domain-containing protein [Dehalococcoidia bacterium]|nr:zinc ribbon domain-containing protein [Dehalococcoidia bacterium]
MPIYEYLCSDCNFKFELLRPLSKADEKAPCPRCHKDAQRTVSACAAFSRGESGETTPLAGSGSSCTSCSATSCRTCSL